MGPKNATGGGHGGCQTNQLDYGRPPLDHPLQSPVSRHGRYLTPQSDSRWAGGRATECGRTDTGRAGEAPAVQVLGATSAGEHWALRGRRHRPELGRQQHEFGRPHCRGGGRNTREAPPDIGQAGPLFPRGGDVGSVEKREGGKLRLNHPTEEGAAQRTACFCPKKAR